MTIRWASAIISGIICGSIIIAMLQTEQTVQVTIGSKTFRLEVADSAEERAKGLMDRITIPTDGGMLFTFEAPAIQTFWMKNTKIPLDIVFLAGGKVVDLVTLPPETAGLPVPIHTSIAPADQVIELNAGTAGQLGIKVGDAIDIK